MQAQEREGSNTQQVSTVMNPLVASLSDDTTFDASFHGSGAYVRVPVDNLHTNGHTNNQTDESRRAQIQQDQSPSQPLSTTAKSSGVNGRICGYRRFRVYSWLVSFFFVQVIIGGFFFIAICINFDDMVSPMEFYGPAKLLGQKWRKCTLTFYYAKDKCLPSGNISYPLLPPSNHTFAGGTGSIDDPITFGAAPQIFPVGTIVYNPRLRKYFIHEDACDECTAAFVSSGGRQCLTAVWMGPDYAVSSPNLVGCAQGLTTAAKDDTLVYGEIPKGLPVNTAPLYDGQLNACILKSYPVCIQQSMTQCGTLFNNCSIPIAASCSSLAKSTNLTLARFSQLNPSANCGSNNYLASGSLICLGGPCGN